MRRLLLNTALVLASLTIGLTVSEVSLGDTTLMLDLRS
jgi:hypothetical protein